MTKKCLGCGISLQSQDSNAQGYIPENKIKDGKYCERCFKIINYNTRIVTKLPNINKYIIDYLNKKKHKVYFMIDFLSISNETMNTFKKLKCSKSLIISKLDIIPNSIKESIIKKSLQKTYDIQEDIWFLSAVKKINTNSLINDMVNNNHQEAYLVGYTNSGKSTLLNKICEQNKIKREHITTSSVPNTTIDFMAIPINDITIYDSPGFTYEKTLYEEDEFALIKRSNSEKLLKPRTYQVKPNTIIILENKIAINSDIPNSLTFYNSNNIEINKTFTPKEELSNKEEKIYEIPANSDLIIKSIGFINIKNSCQLKINTNYHELIEIRPSIFQR